MHPRFMVPCLLVVALAVVLLASGVSAAGLFGAAAALACPLMMIFMMRGMHGGHHKDATTEHTS